jgi:hypothetical protein
MAIKLQYGFQLVESFFQFDFTYTFFYQMANGKTILAKLLTLAKASHYPDP